MKFKIPYVLQLPRQIIFNLQLAFSLTDLHNRLAYSLPNFWVTLKPFKSKQTNYTKKCANNNADQSVVCCGFMSPFGITSACFELKGGDTRKVPSTVHNITPWKYMRAGAV